MVIRYTGLSLFEIKEMLIDEYLYYYREAFIHYMNKTEDGRKYLENAYFYKQTKPDRSRLREKFGKRKK